MATNIVKKSLGTITMENGSNLPTHVSSIGSTFIDNVNGYMYIYRDDHVWEKINESIFCDLSSSANTTAVSTTTGFVKLIGYTFTTISNYGLTPSANTYEYYVDVAGDYFCSVYATIKSVATNVNIVYLGVSTGTTISAGNYTGGLVATGTNRPIQDNVSLNTVVNNVPAGSKLSIYIRSGSAGTVVLGDVRFYAKLMI